MTIIKTYLTFFVALTSLLSFGQVQKIKVVKDKIDIVGIWDSYLPENPKNTQTWEFKPDGAFVLNQLDEEHKDSRSKYSYDQKTLTITMRIDSEYKTLKFLVKKKGDNLKLDLIESKPPLSVSVKTLMLTRKK